MTKKRQFFSTTKTILFLVSFLLGLTLNQSAMAQPIWYEIEDANLTDMAISSKASGFSGTGYVTNITSSTSKATFTITMEEAGLYALTLGYRTPNGEKEYLLKINGEVNKGMMPASNTFRTLQIGKAFLKKGVNEFVFEKGWGWYELDYLMLAPSYAGQPDYPADELIDTLATKETKNLFNYLKSVYGQKMVSAQQELSDVSYVRNVTGNTPAIANIDLIEYSPSRVARGANAQSISENSISWVQDDTPEGIIGSSWHWNAPTDLIDTPGKEWWRGFYTYATTFNFADAMADTTSTRYQLMLRDIDAIAVQLQKFEDANVPILWRPLHEASGTWFWWGAQGPEAYIELWKLLVTRLRDHHGLHNLIWVYTTGDADWYPGDEWVDIIGHDIYTEKGSPFSTQWDDTFNQFNGKKMIALTESGTLPVPEFSPVYGTWWSWYSLWSGGFVRDIPHNELTDVFTDTLVINRGDLPNWSAGVFVSKDEQMEVPSTIDVSQNYPNPINPSTNISFSMPVAQHVKLEIFDVTGRQITVLVDEMMPAGSHQKKWNAANRPSGVYFYRLSTVTSNSTKKMILIK